MKLLPKLVLNLFMVFATSSTLLAQMKVGDNPTTIDGSAMLEVESTTKGFLPPRMTTGERDAIVLPAKGLVIYNTTLDCLQANLGTPAAPDWVCMKNPSTPPPAVIPSYCPPGSTGAGYFEQSPTKPGQLDREAWASAGVVSGNLMVTGQFLTLVKSSTGTAFYQPTVVYAADGMPWPDGSVTSVDFLQDKFGGTGAAISRQLMTVVANGKVYASNSINGFQELTGIVGVPKQSVVHYYNTGNVTKAAISVLTEDGKVYFFLTGIAFAASIAAPVAATGLVGLPSGKIADQIFEMGNKGVWVRTTDGDMYYYGVHFGVNVAGLAIIGKDALYTAPEKVAIPEPLVSASSSTTTRSIFVAQDGSVYMSGSGVNANSTATTASGAPVLVPEPIPGVTGKVIKAIATDDSFVLLTDQGTVYTSNACMTQTGSPMSYTGTVNYLNPVKAGYEYWFQQPMNNIRDIDGMHNTISAVSNNGEWVEFDIFGYGSGQLVSGGDVGGGCPSVPTTSHQYYSNGITPQAGVVLNPTIVPICK